MLEIISGACLFLGCFLIFSGVIGILRFPDFYSRMHAASVTDTLAAGFILVGLMLLAGWSIVTAKLAMILVFLLFTSPTAGHALGKAAYNNGVMPWSRKP